MDEEKENLIAKLPDAAALVGDGVKGVRFPEKEKY
jgi:hypothetical protein